MFMHCIYVYVGHAFPICHCCATKDVCQCGDGDKVIENSDEWLCE